MPMFVGNKFKSASYNSVMGSTTFAFQSHCFLTEFELLMNTSRTLLLTKITSKMVWLSSVSGHFTPEILELLVFPT